MEESCVKCPNPASAVMSFDYAEGEVWISDHTGPVEPLTGYPMCEIHANRLTPPMGWVLTDRRGPVRPLFVTLEVA